MGLVEKFTLRLRRGEGRLFKSALRSLKYLMHANLPVPGFLRPLYRLLYEVPFATKYSLRWLVNFFYSEPAFRSRCTKVGKNLHLWFLPDVTSHTRIYIGDNVNIFGHLGVGSGRVFDDPTLIVGNNVDLGHNVIFTINKRVEIEDHVNIASDVRILDSDAHPRDPYLRAQRLPPSPDEVKPVRICKHAWIGQGCFIMKGVTIGEGAVIGSNSVVLNDVPAFSVAIGNPARVIVKDTRTKLEAVPPAVVAQPESASIRE